MKFQGITKKKAREILNAHFSMSDEDYKNLKVKIDNAMRELSASIDEFIEADMQCITKTRRVRK